MDKIRDSDRNIRVKHGIILDQTTGGGASNDEEFLDEDPMMVLMECMRFMNLRLVDLFASLDKDQSRSLTHSEFKDGLLVIPQSNKRNESYFNGKIVINFSRNIFRWVWKRLIVWLRSWTQTGTVKLISSKRVTTKQKCITNNNKWNGRKCCSELLDGQKIHQKKLRRLRTVESDLPYEETELGRINIKLRILMSRREEKMRAQREEEREQRALNRSMAMGGAKEALAKTATMAAAAKKFQKLGAKKWRLEMMN